MWNLCVYAFFISPFKGKDQFLSLSLEIKTGHHSLFPWYTAKKVSQSKLKRALCIVNHPYYNYRNFTICSLDLSLCSRPQVPLSSRQPSFDRNRPTTIGPAGFVSSAWTPGVKHLITQRTATSLAMEAGSTTQPVLTSGLTWLIPSCLLYHSTGYFKDCTIG